MKKLFILLLLLVFIPVYADELTEYIEIKDNAAIEEILSSPNVKEIYIKDMEINDISFVNHLERLEKLSIFYSKINLTNLNNKNIKEINIISSYIINDDLSMLANSNLKKLDLDGSYITSIYTLKDVISLEELSLNSISNLRSLEPITYLTNLKKLKVIYKRNKTT